MSTMMKAAPGRISVCHIASGERWAGAEAQVATVLQALARRSDVRVCAVVLNEDRLAQEIRAAGIDLAVFPRKENSFWRTYSRACHFLKHRNVQVLHSHRYKENLLALLIKMRLGNPALVRTQHGNPEPGGLKHRLVYRIDRATGSRVAKVISVSSHLQSYLLTYLRTSQVALIRNGIDLNSIRSNLSRTEAKLKLGIAPASPTVGIVARLDAVKRHDIFLRTAKEIVQKVPDAKFVIAGAGLQRSEIATLSDALNLSEQVVFLGHRNDACDVFRAMDVMLVTSDHEGLPMSVLEAMALGTVVVSRKVGGIPEVIQDGLEGLLIDSSEPASLADACVRVLRDDQCRDRMVTAARNKVVREFSADANAEQLVHLYRTIISHGTFSTSFATVRPAAASDRH